ncbi:hypothetical protein, partial [Leptolyngbya sp. FACHB-36]|uniref:hypothetical protein n=1 Tax=Leptolyngbya sp. FACHB-36 TaxID=2692808 RepID=UPI001A7EF05B
TELLTTQATIAAIVIHEFVATTPRISHTQQARLKEMTKENSKAVLSGCPFYRLQICCFE